MQSGPGSVRFGYGFGGGKVRSVPVFGSGGSSTKRVFLCFSTFKGKDGSGFGSWKMVGGSGFGSWKTVPAVPVPLSVSGLTVLTVPASGSEPPWICLNHFVLITVFSVEFLVACLRIAQVSKGFPSERRIYESTLVGQTKLLSKTCLKKINVSDAFPIHKLPILLHCVKTSINVCFGNFIAITLYQKLRLNLLALFPNIWEVRCSYRCIFQIVPPCSGPHDFL